MLDSSIAYEHSTYLPSILFVDNDTESSREMRQQLEKQGCQVYRTNLSAAGLAKVCKNYFELIVLDVEPVDMINRKIYKQLNSNPDLSELPLVVLTACRPAEESLNWFKKDRPVYCLSSKDASTVTRLWQIIALKHYMAYRYR